MTDIELTLHDLGRRARTLEPGRDELATILRVLDAAPTAHRRLPPAGRSFDRAHRRIAAVAVAAAVAAATAVPTARTALGSAVDTFFGGHAPGHEVNGRVLDRSELPRWLGRNTHRALFVAGSGGHRLIAYRSGPTAYCFDYGTQVGECATADIWAKMLAEHPVVLRGPTSGRGHPRGALFGFTRGDVAAVRLTFDAHPPMTASTSNGGFALPTDARWRPRELTLLDRDRHAIATVDVSRRY